MSTRQVVTVVGLLMPLLAVAAPRVPLTLHAPAVDPIAAPVSAADPLAVIPKEHGPDSDPWAEPQGTSSPLEPAIPGLPEARFLLKTPPTECPRTFQWCQRQTMSPYAFAQSLGPGVGLRLGRLHFEYAQGMTNRFSFFGVGTSFSP